MKYELQGYDQENEEWHYDFFGPDAEPNRFETYEEGLECVKEMITNGAFEQFDEKWIYNWKDRERIADSKFKWRIIELNVKYEIQTLDKNNQWNHDHFGSDTQYCQFDTYEEALEAIKDTCESWEDFKSMDENYIYLNNYDEEEDEDDHRMEWRIERIEEEEEEEEFEGEE